jgi:hypothetical protein
MYQFFLIFWSISLMVTITSWFKPDPAMSLSTELCLRSINVWIIIIIVRSIQYIPIYFI